MTNPFKYLDLEQQKKFKKIRNVLAFYYGALIVLPIVFFWDSLSSSQYSAGAGFYLSPWFLILLIVGLGVCTVLAVGKFRKKKIKNISGAGYYRDTKGIFDFDDPVSILEVLMLCNDYSGGVGLGINLDSENVKRLIINTMIKSGAIVKISDDEIVVNEEKLKDCPVGKELMLPYFSKFPNLVNGVYRKVFFELPSKPKKAEEAQILQSCIKPFACDYGDLTKKDGGINRFDFKKSSSLFGALIEILRSVAAENRKMGKNFNLNSFFSNLRLTLDAYQTSSQKVIESCIISCQKSVKTRFFRNTKKPDYVVGSVAVAVYFIIAIALHIGSMAALTVYFIFLLAPLVFSYVEFLHSLAGEANEELTEEGQGVFDKVLGLRQFIVDFTNIQNIDNVGLIAWDEIAIFASLFGLNDNVKTIFESEGIKLEHQEIYDYLRPLFELNAIDAKMREQIWLLSAIADEGIKTEGWDVTDKNAVTKRRIADAVPLTPENVEKIVETIAIFERDFA